MLLVHKRELLLAIPYDQGQKINTNAEHTKTIVVKERGVTNEEKNTLTKNGFVWSTRKPFEDRLS